MKTQLLVASIIFVLCFASTSFGSSEYRRPLPNLLTSFDPIQFMPASNIAIINQIYDRLFDLDELNEPKSKLVSNWEMNSDGSVYKIYLKDNVLFHDGISLTANDVIFTLKRLLSKKSVLNKEFSIIKGAHEYQSGVRNSVSGLKIISKSSLSVELEKPFPLFIKMLASPKTEVLPDKFHGVPEVDFFRNPIGTGPFKFSKHEEKNYIELVANDQYFLGQPKLKKITYEHTDRKNAISNFNKGHYHDLEWFYPQLTELTTNYSVVKVPISATNILALNFRRPLFKNIHFRKAINYAINKKFLIDSCFPGSNPANGYVPPGLAGNGDKISAYDYKPDFAKEEIQKSGISKEVLAKPIIILRPSSYPCEELFKKIVESDLKFVGINASVVSVPYSELMEKYYNLRNFDMINLLYAADFPDASFMLGDFRSNSLTNYSGFSSAEVDGWLKISNTTANRYERYQTYENIQQILNDKAVTVNICYHIASIVYQSNVKGFKPSPLGTFYSSMWPVYIEEDEK